MLLKRVLSSVVVCTLIRVTVEKGVVVWESYAADKRVIFNQPYMPPSIPSSFPLFDP